MNDEPLNRWFFFDFKTDEFFGVIDNPEAHPDFNHWDEQGRPIVFIGKARLYGIKLRGTQNDEIECAAVCQMAKGAVCSCACGGKRHGEAHKLPKAELPEDAGEAWLDSSPR